MIVRILGEGQFEVARRRARRLNRLDASLEGAFDSSDEEDFRAALTTLLDRVRHVGRSRSPADETGDQLILPLRTPRSRRSGSMLGDEGLIPG